MEPKASSPADMPPQILTTPDHTPEPWAEWVILELMGHRRLAGRLTEVQIAGTHFLRLDVYNGDAPTPELTQFYRPAAVYAITPVTEDAARRVGAPEADLPVARYELEPF